MRKGRYVKIFILVCLALLQTGCKITFLGRTEIDDMEFIRVVGIDKSPEKEGFVRLTIATQRIQADGSNGGAKKRSSIITSEGRTVFEAVRNFWSHMDKRPFWGHIEYALIGEEAAKDGILKYLDFFCRDAEVRLNIRIFVTEGSSAEEVILKATGENRFIIDQLNGVTDNRSGQSVINVVDLVEVMYILDREYLCLYLPCVVLEQRTKPNMQNDAMDIAMGGFAVFDGEKQAIHLDKKMGRGLNWLRNKVKSGIIPITSPKGNNISLEIIESNVKLKPKLTDQNLTVHVNVFLTCNIGGITGREDVFTEESVAFLEKQLGAAVKSEIEDVIRFAQEKGMDFFSTGDAFFRQYHIQWEDELEKKWKAIFPEVVFKVDVTPVITGTYNILQPNRTRKDDK